MISIANRANELFVEYRNCLQLINSFNQEQEKINHQLSTLNREKTAIESLIGQFTQQLNQCGNWHALQARLQAITREISNLDFQIVQQNQMIQRLNTDGAVMFESNGGPFAQQAGNFTA